MSNRHSMKLDVFRYRLPLTTPLLLRGVTLTHREGLLLRLENEDGHCGWGDVAPLTGFSRETLGEAAQAVEQVRERVGELPLSEDALDSDGALETWLDAWMLPPSVRFGIELAVANLRAVQSGTTLPHVFAAAPHDVVPVNALLAGDEDDLVREAERLRHAGYRTVKLKVGRRQIADDVRRARAVAEALEPDVLLRLDVNRAWVWDEASAFADGLRGVDIEYVEEPLAQPKNLSRFAQQHPHLPLALDETTREHDPSILADMDHVRAVVLKPTLLGGIVSVTRWARAARQRGMKVVLSTSFESGVGLLGLVALAAALGDGATAHGLGVHGRLAADVLAPRPAWAGHIYVPALLATPTALVLDYPDPLFDASVER